MPIPQAADAHDAGKSSEQLFAEVYQRLKAMASRQRARAGGATLNTTAIVHEAYLRICEDDRLHFEDPLQFFGYAARAMRSIMVDASRRRLCRDRIGLVGEVDPERIAAVAADGDAVDALAIDAALQRLERDDPRAARLVELHYFAGLSLPRIAGILGVTTRTLNRDWRFARAYLSGMLD